MNAERQAAGANFRGHLARFALNFVAQRGNGFHHARTRAIGARLAEGALERLLGALARDSDEPEFIEAQDFRWRAVGTKGILERSHHLFTVAPLLHVDEVDDDDAAE